MKKKNSTEMLPLRDVRGSLSFYPDRLRVKSFEAFLSWEMLQRGVAHNHAKMTEEEITLLCGGSPTLPYAIIGDVLDQKSESVQKQYNSIDGQL